MYGMQMQAQYGSLLPCSIIVAIYLGRLALEKTIVANTDVSCTRTGIVAPPIIIMFTPASSSRS